MQDFVVSSCGTQRNVSSSPPKKYVHMLIPLSYKHIVTWQREIRVAIKLRLLTLNEGDHLDYPGGSTEIPRILKSGRGRQIKTSEQCDVRRTKPTIAGFEGRDKRPGPENVCSFQKAKKGKEMYSPLELPERTTALPTPSSQSTETHVRILNYKTIRKYVHVALSH